MGNLSKWQLGCFVFAAVAFALLAISGCVPEGRDLGQLLDRSGISMNFFINETFEPLDGELFINDKYLGNTTNGTIRASKKLLVPGTLTLSGRDDGGNYKFYFEFSPTDIRFDTISFQVPQKDYDIAVFDASKLDAKLAEREIFSLANEERAKQGIGPLRLNERVAGVARAYSKVLPVEGFHHTGTGGGDVKKRLSDKGIIFIATNENLFLTSSMQDEADLARLAIEGWLESPGHRATLLDRDKIYSDVGIGVHCEKKECYAVMDFAAMLQEQKAFLKRGWVTFYYLHNPGYDFAQQTIPVKFELSSSAPVNVYVVKSYDSYKKFTDSNGEELTGLVTEFKGTSSISRVFNAERGSGVIIEATTADAGSSVKFSLDFS